MSAYMAPTNSSNLWIVLLCVALERAIALGIFIWFNCLWIVDWKLKGEDHLEWNNTLHHIFGRWDEQNYHHMERYSWRLWWRRRAVEDISECHRWNQLRMVHCQGCYFCGMLLSPHVYKPLIFSISICKYNAYCPLGHLVLRLSSVICPEKNKSDCEIAKVCNFLNASCWLVEYRTLPTTRRGTEAGRGIAHHCGQSSILQLLVLRIPGHTLWPQRPSLLRELLHSRIHRLHFRKRSLFV
jgi:hypothetical protein